MRWCAHVHKMEKGVEAVRPQKNFSFCVNQTQFQVSRSVSVVFICLFYCVSVFYVLAHVALLMLIIDNLFTALHVDLKYFAMRLTAWNRYK